MKFYLIFLLLLCFNAQAMFVAKSEVGALHSTKFFSQKECESAKSEKCFKITREYLPQAATVVTKSFEVPDTSKPQVFSRKEAIVSCASKTDCEVKKQSKKCDSFGERYYAGIDYDQNRIFCVENFGHPKKTISKEIVELDAAKKTAALVKIAEGKIKEKLVKGVLDDIAFGKIVFAQVRLLYRGKSMDKASKKLVRQATKAIREDLFEGYLEEAKEKIDALPTDGLISEADKVAASTLIANYLAKKAQP